ncbi:hypothetical protein C8R43DRAFT_1027510 [Mycena crocata]|nr:hypothetical protein C8R43DRAFT_1027510 [Mycena crocata]
MQPLPLLHSLSFFFFVLSCCYSTYCHGPTNISPSLGSCRFLPRFDALPAVATPTLTCNATSSQFCIVLSLSCYSPVSALR